MKKHSLTLILSLILALTMITGSTLVFADDNTTDIVKTDEENENSEDVRDQTASEVDNTLYGGSSDIDAMKSALVLNTIDYADISDDYDKKVVGLLDALGIMQISDKGEFRPDDPFSRYDLAYAMLKLQNIDFSQYTSELGTFRDVENGSDEQKVMSIAVQNGYLKTDSTGAVKPNDSATLSDLLTAAVKVLGYEPSVKSGDFAGKAISLKLDKNVDTSAPFTRITAAGILYNTARAPYFKVTAYGDNVKYTKSNDVTLLSEFHDIHSSTGIVCATETAGINDYKKTERNTINIDGTIYDCTLKSSRDYISYSVEYYYRDVSGSKDELVFMYKDDDVKELVIPADSIESYSKMVYKYWEKGKIRTANIASEHNFIYNGADRADYAEKDFLPKNGYVKLVSNGGKNYNNVFVWEYYNAVVENTFTREDSAVISFLYGYKELVVDFGDDDMIADIYKGNAIADLTIGRQDYVDGDGVWQSRILIPSIPRYTLVSIYADRTKQLSDGHIVADESASYIKIILNEKSVTGRVSSQSSKGNASYATISANTYEICSDNYMDKNEQPFAIGSYGTFMLDYSGKIASWIPKENPTTWKYGYLINAGLSEGLSKTLQVKLLSVDDGVKIYNCTKRIFVNDKKSTAEEALKTLRNSAKMLDANFTISQTVKYRQNESGDITDFETVTASLGVAAGYEKNHLRRARNRESIEYRSGIGGAYIVKTTHDEDDRKTGKISTVSRVTNLYQGEPEVFFHVPLAETFKDEDYYVGDWLPDNSSKQCELFNVDDTLRPNVVVVYDSDADYSNLPYPYMLVTNITYGVDQDGNDTAIVTGYTGSTKRSYYTKTPDIAKGLKKGDFVSLGGKKSVIYDYDVITTVDKILSEDISGRETSVIAKYSVGTGNDMCAVFEPWDYVDYTRGLIVQRGTPIDDENRRDFQKVSWFMKNSPNYAGLISVYVEKGTDKMFFESGSIGDIKGAREYGHDDCSRVFLVETSNYTWRITIIVNYI